MISPGTQRHQIQTELDDMGRIVLDRDHSMRRQENEGEEDEFTRQIQQNSQHVVNENQLREAISYGPMRGETDNSASMQLNINRSESIPKSHTELKKNMENPKDTFRGTGTESHEENQNERV